ncbi:ATP phosphoribosyltransferase [Candidatus Kaiserbacteria bacterium RIFCSPHIGHO2_02_FULL_59_21]|uniref:ATP phosphoribosyltransferase n=1 Tax=Candidatus Kaiserbacteria bacterium RIFCSPHIGHO2_02_FULL_59_21 TaxID=1798500 RepID=A0A1F6E1N2_9BACT|nr:MAG: ATP phosphoribosyltransferase [Candidatus Kaiserbacteria bacterium RIFCSPHIGHO2_01_FULL_58_22]OGG67536.1 MAG: ATP phosphoribosyltransferase [Candidatus Kaiserbacteria bacterium RIFCSPHIGHO2_02_FULL_59_21]OGG80140.1 MAG: ATP phosphoribosyltransferase [Candidatus Kaiserbacteria bacterium RIFCSPLOWO2_01_FULL_59_34]OGG86931.1 MAG: ATP phosphoribosyltransferase [Candidatus Kaiserbacteria bacterium RIFCSPLOWO2_02_FULL_59_19]
MMHLIYNQERLRIAVQKKGRLHEASMKYLSSRGLSFPQNGKSLIQSSEDSDVDVLYLRDDDIPEYVMRGVADLGIVGENVLAERDKQLSIVAKLGFGECKLIIAVPKNSRMKVPADLRGKRIATSYPNLLSAFLKKEGVEAEIVSISGSAEITVELDLADAVCDITQTGATLAAHELVPIVTIMESQAVLIESAGKSMRKQDFLKGL